jgi:hypothetical protein
VVEEGTSTIVADSTPENNAEESPEEESSEETEN